MYTEQNWQNICVFNNIRLFPAKNGESKTKYPLQTMNFCASIVSFMDRKRGEKNEKEEGLWH
jgi:hypothetical protein